MLLELSMLRVVAIRNTNFYEWEKKVDSFYFKLIDDMIG